MDNLTDATNTMLNKPGNKVLNIGLEGDQRAAWKITARECFRGCRWLQ